MNAALTTNKNMAADGLEEYRRALEQANRELQREIEERRRAEATLHAYAQRLDHQIATQVAILSAQSLSDTLDISLRHVLNSLPCNSASVVMYDFERNEVEILRSNHPEYFPGNRIPIRLPESIDEMRAGNHYIVREVGALAPAHPGMQIAADSGGHTLLMVPLRYREELIGALTILTDHIHDFTADELVISREIASSLAIAIQHRRLLTAEQEAREREATLRQVAQSLTADLELDVVLRDVLDQLEKLVPSTSSAIFLRNGDRMRIATSRAVRTSDEMIEQFAEAFPAYMQNMMVEGTPRLIQDTALDPDFVKIEGSEYIRSWLGVPLVAKGVVFGILTLDREDRNAFSNVDLSTASILAAQAAIGIQNARLYADEQQYAIRLKHEVSERTRELQTLYEISAGSENLELEQLLEFSLRKALEAAGYSAGMIHLADEITGSLTLAATQGLSNSILGFLDPKTTIGREFHERLANTDTLWSSSGPTRIKMQLCAEFEACTITPLRAQGRVLGVLTLMSDEEQPLTPAQLRLMSAIADQIGLVVESADLRRHARQTAVLAERERIAADLHDMVTQSLYSLILFSEAARETALQGDMAEAQKNLQIVMHTARHALGEMRMLLYDLRSAVLAETGLAAALAFRLATVEQPSGLKTELIVQHANDLPATVEDVLYRVALESLNNTLRHADADEVEVTIAINDGSVLLCIDDNGCGFEVTAAEGSPGMGLRNMHRRIHEAGGTLLIESAPGQGARIEAQVPLGQPGTAQARQTARKGN